MLQQRNGDKKIKDKIKNKTGTLQISTRRSILRFFLRTRLAALFSGCYDSKFLMLDGKPLLDISSECFRDLAEFLAGCKKAKRDSRARRFLRVLWGLRARCRPCFAASGSRQLMSRRWEQARIVGVAEERAFRR